MRKNKLIVFIALISFLILSFNTSVISSEGVIEVKSDTARFKDNNTYILNADVNFGISKITVQSGSPKLNLNGYTLSSNYSDGHVILVSSGTSLEIISTEGSITCSTGTAIQASGDLTIAGGMFSGTTYSIIVTGGTTVINGGNYDKTINVNGGNLLINAGSFRVCESEAVTLNTYVVEGKELVLEGGVYVVKEKVVFQDPVIEEPIKEESTSTYCQIGDLNCDGIIDCEEALGEGYIWDESIKACVFPFKIPNTGIIK